MYTKTECIGISLALPLPSWPNSFHFQAVFSKNLAKQWDFPLKLMGWLPPSVKSWIRRCLCLINIFDSIPLNFVVCYFSCKIGHNYMFFLISCWFSPLDPLPRNIFRFHTIIQTFRFYCLRPKKLSNKNNDQ